jgi:uncharacterized membrane protein
MRREAIGSLQKRSQQRGAAAVFAGIALVAMLAATTLVIDIGRLYLAQQQLQKQADIAALDSVRRVSSCSATEVPTQGELEAAASQSLARNGLEDIAAENLTVTAGRIISDEESSFRELIAEPMETASAVRVTVARALPASLFPRGASAGSQRMRASATAMQPAAGSFYLGSTLASVDDGLLNAVIGGLICPTGDTACQNSVIALDVASASAGLLETSVTVAQLATALGVRVADLSDPVALSLMNPLLPDVLSDLSGALSATASGTVVALLDSLAGAAEGSAVPMGELFDDISADTPNAPLINLFDLLLALSQSAKADASGTTPIQLPINLSVPGIADIGVFLKVLEGPQFSGMGRPGQAMAETAQLTLGVRIAGGALLTGLSGVLDGIVNGIVSGLLGALTGITINVDTLSPPLNIGIDVEAGKARAWLDRLDCPREGVNGGLPVAALSAEPSTAEVRVGSFTGGAFGGAPLDDSGSEKRVELAQVEIDGSCVGLLGLCLPGVSAGSATIDIALDLTTISVGGAVNPIALNEIRDFQRVETDDAGNPIPDWHPPVWRAEGAPNAPPSPDNPQQVGAATNINIAMGVDVEKVDGSGLVGLVGDLLAALTTAVTNLIDGLLDVVNGLVATLIDPLLLALGVQTGTAEVTMDTVSIGHPRLVDTRVPEQQDN